MRRGLLGLLLGLSFFSTVSSLEFWPFLNYAMFSCAASREIIVAGMIAEDGKFRARTGVSFSFIDGFSFAETARNFETRGLLEERNRFLRPAKAKLNPQENFWRVRIETGASGEFVGYTPLEKIEL